MKNLAQIGICAFKTIGHPYLGLILLFQDCVKAPALILKKYPESLNVAIVRYDIRWHCPCFKNILKSFIYCMRIIQDSTVTLVRLYETSKTQIRTTLV